jgi:outer membrane protein assembly factor BamD (BamD/ComL family)
MEISRVKTIAIAALCFLAANPCYATGGDSYEYPATLSDTLDMLPGKSLGEIFLETSTIKPPAGSWDSNKLRQLADRIGKEPLPQLLKAADDLIAQARAAYTPGSDYCNLAHDVHDAIAVSAENPSAAREYILERLNGHLTSDELGKRAESVRGAIKANWLYACGAKQFSAGDRTECATWFDRVAKEFPQHPRTEIAMFMSARCAFSATRANIDQGSDDSTPDPKLVKLRKTAIAKFDALRKKYPRGRFDADALGWLGALAFDSRDYLKALDYYIAQAESPGHPETLMSAIYNCEKTLAHLAPKPGGDAAFALIARHPRIAMGFTYLVLSAPEADNYDGKWDNPADVRKWRRTILPRIAAVVAKQKDAYKADDWQPRYLAMLVHAASASGNQVEALQLSQISPDQLKKSDDLMFARGIALQRANKTLEAIDAFQTFLRTFPKSRMMPGVKIRLALALEDNHEGGKAIATLRDLLASAPTHQETSTNDAKKSDEEEEEGDSDSTTEKESSNQTAGENSGSEEGATGFAKFYDASLWTRYMSDSNGYPEGERQWNARNSAAYENLSGADEEQVRQFIDTLMNLAPLPELLGTPDDKNLDEKGKEKARAILAERYLEAENFAEAKNYLVDPKKKEIAGRLEQLTNDNSGTPEQKAERMLKVGDAWAEARGNLLRAPLDTDKGYEGTPFPGLLRRENGHTLGLKDVEDQLDDRDELHHASRWWMRAARALPGTRLSAKARLKALEALPQIARASSYAEQRAREIKLEAVSREIYDKLRAESPNSLEAQRLAAYWSLPPVSKEESETAITASDNAPLVSCDDDAAPFGYPLSDNHAFDRLTRTNEPAESEDYRFWNDIEKRVKALRANPDAREVKDLAESVRKKISTDEAATIANCLDDLAQFLSEPNPPSNDARIAYVDLRLNLLHRTHWPESPVDPGISINDSDDAVAAQVDAAEKNPALKSFHDYLDFCRIGLIAGQRVEVTSDIPSSKEPDGTSYHSRNFPQIEKMTRDFLTKYPRSRKREAALFVVARTIYSLSCPRILCVEEGETDELVQRIYRKEAFDPNRVLKALDDYDREFPNGRYAADVRDMCAATFWRMGQWDKALDLTLAQIADKSKVDLLGSAETRLANIFAELANVEHRPAVLEAIRARPAAIPYLAAYAAAAASDRAHPLRYLQRYLSDQLHFKIPPPPEKQVAAN